jgi:hypothetical protein
MPEVDINYWIVLVGVVISMVLGFVWYSPGVFGKMWMEALGKKEMKADNSVFLLMAVAAAVLTYIMIHFAAYAGVVDAASGLATGFWLWLGFVATVGIGKTVFGDKSLKGWMIDNGYTLVQLLLIGLVIGMWR